MAYFTKYGLVFFCVLALNRVDAQDFTEERSANLFPTDLLFQKPGDELSFNSGVLFSPVVATYKRPVINYTLTEVQYGLMASNIRGAGVWRGNLEVVGEGFGSAIFQGSGSYIAGITIWARYNFVHPGWRFVPYAQAGAGFVSTDIDHHIVGQPFNFNLDLGAGTRVFLTEHWALDLEGRYQHVSNANMGRRNLGINAAGPMLGLSYFF